jgi:hypothetical protein
MFLIWHDFTMFRSIMKFGFQRVVALLLLATFAPLAVLSEAGHLIPGLSGSCDCFKVVGAGSSHNPQAVCYHAHGAGYGCGNAEGIRVKFIEVETTESSDVQHGDCVLHEFCSLFNSVGIMVVVPPVSDMVTERDGVELLLLSFVFCSNFQARAPPLV